MISRNKKNNKNKMYTHKRTQITKMSKEGKKGQTNSSYRDLCTLGCRGHRTRLSLPLNAYDDLNGMENERKKWNSTISSGVIWCNWILVANLMPVFCRFSFSFPYLNLSFECVYACLVLSCLPFRLSTVFVKLVSFAYEKYPKKKQRTRHSKIFGEKNFQHRKSNSFSSWRAE